MKLVRLILLVLGYCGLFFWLLGLVAFLFGTTDPEFVELSLLLLPSIPVGIIGLLIRKNFN